METDLMLFQPPFITLAHDIASRPECDTFYSRFWSLDQIDPTQAIVFAAFEHGSDSGLILDYRDSPQDPTVRYLQWSRNGAQHNEWVTVAPNFNAWADILGL